MAKRSKKTIRKAQAAILKEAERLQKAGINVAHRFVVVGGARPVRVAELKGKQK